MRFLVLGRDLRIPNNEFHLGVLVLYMVHCYLASDVAVWINITYKIECCYWILIQRCTEDVLHTWNDNNILVNMFYSMQFSTSYLFIPGISSPWQMWYFPIFFFFQLQGCAVPFIYITVFWKDSKRGSVVKGRGQLWGHNNHLIQDWFV